MSGLVHVSLFSGIGGIDLAMSAAGVPTVLACELDAAARMVLADRFPETELHDDVRTLTGDTLRRLITNPRRTVLSAGFPCQDLSVAGARRGMVEGSGTRSALYWEVDRLLADFRPGWVVLENVPGLLSSRGGRDMGAILGSLAERGYGFAYRVLDAQHFGVPQRRRRVVIVGHLGDDGRAPAQVLLEPEGLRGDLAASIAPRPLFAPAARSSARARGVLGDHSHALTAEGHDASEDGTGRGTPIIAFAARRANALDTAQGGPDDNSAQAGHLIATFQKVIRPQTDQHPDVWEHREVAATLSPFDLGSDGRSVELVVDPAVVVRRLTPTECERLQGFPDGHTATRGGKAQADSPRYKQLGNAVAVPVFEWVVRRLVAVDAGTEPICVECGDDLAAEGLEVCTECAESLGDMAKAVLSS